MNIQQFWSDVLAQRADEIREYFHTDAYVNWHCSNEHFTVEEFIRANCEYPGDWDGEVEKIVTTDDLIITATRVYPKSPSVKRSRKTTLRSFGSSFTPITSGICFPTQTQRKEITSSVMNTDPRCNKSTTERKIGATTYSFNGTDKT